MMVVADLDPCDFSYTILMRRLVWLRAVRPVWESDSPPGQLFSQASFYPLQCSIYLQFIRIYEILGLL